MPTGGFLYRSAFRFYLLFLPGPILPGSGIRGAASV